MNNRFFNALIIGSIINLATVTATGAAGWSRLTPKGTGFSAEVPGERQPDTAATEYRYASGLWLMAVDVQPVDPATRQLVERRERKALLKCLESIRDKVIDGFTGKLRGSSSGDIDGNPSLRFSYESTELEGTNLMVITVDHLYLVMTVGPKGTSNDDAKRFFKSFRLVATESGTPEEPDAPNASSSDPVASKLAGPMLAVARLAVEEKLNPIVDDVVQNAPPAARIGSRWNPSNTAWQQARTSISGRIERLADRYQNSSEALRALESGLKQLTPESQTALAAALNGPAGPAIVRQLARSQFASAIMANDPDGPRPGDRAWVTQLRELQDVFDRRIGSAMPPDDGSYEADVERFFSAHSSDVFRVCLSAVSTATRELETAINLMLFDNSDAIQREIEAVIARAK